MSKICYVPKTFRGASLALIQTCNTIIGEYTAAGYVLTLRQLYYQLVARDIIANKQEEYKRLGNVINDARLAGLIDWLAIEDRTRNLASLPSWNGPEEIVDACSRQFRYDAWEGQPYYVEVWVEKEALAGVIQRTANSLGCPWLSCRGYMSQSEMWAAGVRFGRFRVQGRKPVVIHLGDHDPSGIDMTRDTQDRLELFSRGPVTVNRIALNYDQVEQYNPPPNPAKSTDTRYQAYMQKHGEESWELDALDPATLDGLIREAVNVYLDHELYNTKLAETEQAKSLLKSVSDNWQEVVDMLAGDGLN